MFSSDFAKFLRTASINLFIKMFYKTSPVAGSKDAGDY